MKADQKLACCNGDQCHKYWNQDKHLVYEGWSKVGILQRWSLPSGLKSKQKYGSLNHNNINLKQYKSKNQMDV